MSDQTQKEPMRLRTFAADLEAARTAQQHAKTAADTPEPKETKKVKKQKAPKQVAAAPKLSTKPEPPKPVPPAPAPKREPESRNETVLEAEPEPAPTAPNNTSSETTPTASTKIPAFHEIEKSVQAIQEDIVADKDPESDKKRVRPNVGYDTTIITDTKSNRFKFFPSLAAGLSKWAASFTKKRKKKKQPQYVVPKTERRKGVIQKATSKTGTVFTADNDALKELIRKRQSEKVEIPSAASKQKPSVPEPADEPETTWSPFTEPGFALLEEPDETPTAPTDSTQNVQVAFKRIAKPPVETPPVPAPSPKSVPKPAPVPVPEFSPTPQEETELEAEPVPEPQQIVAPTAATTEEVLVAQEPEPMPEPQPEPSEEAMVDADDERWNATVEPNETAYEDDPDTTDVEQVDLIPDYMDMSSRQLVTRVDTNTLAIVVLLLLIIIGSVIFSAHIIFKQLLVSEPEAQVSFTPHTSVSGATKLTGIVLDSAQVQRFTTTLDDAIASSSAGLVELAIMAPTGEELSPSYIFDLLDSTVMPTFRQSLLAVRFVTLNHNQPTLALQFTDIETAQGGLLHWENTMLTDLQDLYDLPTDDTLTFTDDQIGGIDVRIVRTEGETVLMYGIVDEDLILITPSRAAFTHIVELQDAK